MKEKKATLLLAQIKAAEELLQEFTLCTESVVKEMVGEFGKLKQVDIDGEGVLVTMSDILSVDEFAEVSMVFSKLLQEKILARKAEIEEELANLNK